MPNTCPGTSFLLVTTESTTKPKELSENGVAILAPGSVSVVSCSFLLVTTDY